MRSSYGYGIVAKTRFRNRGRIHRISCADKPQTDLFNLGATPSAAATTSTVSTASVRPAVGRPAVPSAGTRASQSGPHGGQRAATSEMTIWAVDYRVWWQAARALILREMRTRCLRVPDAGSPVRGGGGGGVRDNPIDAETSSSSSCSSGDAIELRTTSAERLGLGGCDATTTIPGGLQRRLWSATTLA